MKKQKKTKSSVKPTVISTFSGCGGSSLGYHWAGFEELLAIDFNSHAVESFKANLGHVLVWNRDITTITPEVLLKAIRIAPGELDLLDGSPPCQGFSTAGNRQVNDPRNQLFLSFVTLIEGLQPKVFVMENVTGMINGKMKGLFLEILNTLKSTNYLVKAKVMNSKYYGVAQSRERLIFIGVHPDLKLQPSFPTPINKLLSVKDAFGQINENDTTGTEIRNMRMKQYAQFTKPGEGVNKYHPKGNYFNTRRVYWRKPAQTVTKTVNLLHPFENRYLSIPEVKAITSFPQNFVIPGTYQQQWAVLGNAVMPNFMYHIAKHLKKEVLNYE